MMCQERFTVLVADDEKTNIDILHGILSPTCSVITAKNGPEAIEKVYSHKPDLILLDAIMPNMSGYDVFTKLNNDEETKRIPVILMTDSDCQEDEERGLRLGAADYISKPLRDSVVELRVGTHRKIIEQDKTIEHLSTIDVLTNIPNRRCFDMRAKTEWERAMREQTTLSLMLIDIDHFKQYNDTHGHQQGDKLLKAISKLFEDLLFRPADFISRWGGEEFAALLPNTDETGALDVAERLRVGAEKLEIFDINGEKTQTTISIGIASEKVHTHGGFEEFFRRADMALYEAKRAGRNCVKSS